MSEVRELIQKRLREDLVGPLEPDEKLTSYPTDVYMTGIMFPLGTAPAPEEGDELEAEGSGGGDGGTTGDEVAHGKCQRPPAIGLSFAIEFTGIPAIDIEFTAARYRLDAIEQDDDSDQDDEQSAQWQREALSAAVSKIELGIGSQDIGQAETGLDGVRFNIVCSNWDGKFLVTVTAINTLEYEFGAGRAVMEEACLFQTELRVRCNGEATRFHRRPLKWTAADEDSESARLLYRDSSEYAVGHVCSATWDETAEGPVKWVSTAWLPESIVPAVSSSGAAVFGDCVVGEADPWSAQWLSATESSDAAPALEGVVDAYTGWLEEQAARVEGLSKEQSATASRHLEAADKVVVRMRGSIELLQTDPDVSLAFRLANRAIVVQRKWGNPGESDLRWRPFQLAFILLSLQSVANRQHPDRKVADLIWFPTGGGKTEAYLGLIAFTLFLRRLRDGEKGGGVAAFMRYTLRLLTVQQFQRATALIMACERIRLGQFLPEGINVDLGQERFSIGLWVGQDAVPNKFVEAAKSLRDGLSSTPRQLTTCPCELNEPVRWYAKRNPDAIHASCTADDCCWGGQEGFLPVWTVDEDIYRERPSLIIGTIDKFAQIVRNSATVALFGSDGKNLPPDLIIQDELHLISGPLGTVAGLYETAIDEICSRGESRPKIVASTATIREARAQIKALFDRDACLFPPSIVDASNSGFAVVDEQADGRLYLGLTTAGRSAKYMLQAVAASVLQSVAIALAEEKPKADWYATLVAYFNSLRELGGALVLMQDDVERTLATLVERRDEKAQLRSIDDVTELTSRVNSAEVRDILDRLEITSDKDGSIDVLLASNMISVGVDISRLGLMIVNGQPKGMAEYIQSTSRVGRGQVPGLVITVYNDAKTRDRSHFETFRTWHDSIYRDVEATSVTPFSSRARDRALHAALVGLVRHSVSGLLDSPTIGSADRVDVEALADLIVARAGDVDAQEKLAVKAELDEIIDRWSYRAGLKSYWTDQQINTSLLISAEEAAKRRALGRRAAQAWATPNSMRNVEPSTTFVFVRRLKRRNDNG